MKRGRKRNSVYLIEENEELTTHLQFGGVCVCAGETPKCEKQKIQITQNGNA